MLDMGFIDPSDPVLSSERKRAQKVVAYVVNQLTGVHLTLDESRTIYNRLVASTAWADAELEWPPASIEIVLVKLNTGRRIKE